MKRWSSALTLSLVTAAWWVLSVAPAFADSDFPSHRTTDDDSTIVLMAGGIVVVIVIVIAVAAIVGLRRAAQYRSDEGDS
jgi:hypothetical protein